MAQNNFSAETKSFKDLLIADKIYVIPPYQRDYSWDNSNGEWDDLWNDITSQDFSEHFVGFLVFKEKNSKEVDVIDGQQRMATITIIILSALDLLKDCINTNKDVDIDEEKERLKDLSYDYIGRKDTTTRKMYNKIVLNKTNGDYFKELCDEKISIKTQILPIKDASNKSNKKIRACFEFFKMKIKTKLENSLTGEAISKLIEDMARKLFFTVLNVDSEANAYTLFETLNARGVKLASVDLLKNFLYSQSSGDQDHLSVMEENWNEIMNNVREGDLNRFIRTDWGTRNSLVEDRKLFKVISKNINTNDEAFKYIEELKNSSNLFNLLLSPTDIFWKENSFNSQEVYSSLCGLKDLRIKQVFGVLIAYLKNMDYKNFHILLGWLEKISFRFNTVSKQDAKEQETLYNDIAKKISQKTFKSLDDIKKSLKKVYIQKEKFIENFAHAEFQNKQTIKYILDKINSYEMNSQTSLDKNTLTVEHILAQSRNDDWNKFENPEDYIWKLGNLTLLDKHTNGTILKGKLFVEKKEIYKKITYPIVQNIANYTSWDADSITSRQRKMAEIAQEIWKIPEFED